MKLMSEATLVDYFPLLGLRLVTPRLELRLPSLEELGGMAGLAADGIHHPDAMPFRVPWTDQPPGDVARCVIQHHWQRLGDWSPQQWSLNLAVFHAGAVVGQQTISACEFATTREVCTGSWLGRRYQGLGIGTEMRAAVLDLVFAGLGAEEATSAAFAHNAASLAVSRKLGYQPDGIERRAVRGVSTVSHRLRLTRTDWQQRHYVSVRIEGLTAAASRLFGNRTKG